MRMTRSKTRQLEMIDSSGQERTAEAPLSEAQPPSFQCLPRPDERGGETIRSYDTVLCKADSYGNISSFDLRISPPTVCSRPPRIISILLLAWHAICWMGRRLFGHTQLEHFERNVKLAFFVNGEEKLLHVKAKFDTGNPKNLMSLALAKRFGIFIPKGQERHVLELPGGSKYMSIWKEKGRWTCDDDYRIFGQRFIDSEFEISTGPERFDIIIGSDTIAKERLAFLDLPAGYTGWRAELPVVDVEKNKIDQTNQDQWREQNESDKQKRRQEKKKAQKAARPRPASSERSK